MANLSYFFRIDSMNPKISLENPLLKSANLLQPSWLVSTKSSIPLTSNLSTSLLSSNLGSLNFIKTNPLNLTSINIQNSRMPELKDDLNHITSVKYSLSFDIKPKYVNKTSDESAFHKKQTHRTSSVNNCISKSKLKKPVVGIKRKPNKVLSDFPANKVAKKDNLEMVEDENEMTEYSSENYEFSQGKFQEEEEIKLECVFPDSISINEENIDIIESLEIQYKKQLVNMTSASLIIQCNFKNSEDEVGKQMKNLTNYISTFDPEFILKLALYCRTELNIRTTSNFLIALAAINQPCRKFISKYFNLSIVLPSDWIEVGEFYLNLTDEKFLTTSLRRAMVKKFPEFDQYQLAKYNKEKSRKKKKVPTATLR